MPKDQVPSLYERIVQLYFLCCIYQQQDESFRTETWLGKTTEVLVNQERTSALTVVLFTNDTLLYAFTRTIEAPHLFCPISVVNTSFQLCIWDYKACNINCHLVI